MPSSTACPTPAPRPPTPTYGCSPAAPTATTAPKHSSPWPTSPAAASAHHYPDDHETRPTETSVGPPEGHPSRTAPNRTATAPNDTQQSGAAVDNISARLTPCS